MNHYSVHFVDRGNYVFALEQLDSSDDPGAIAKATSRPLPPFGAGFEVWRDERLIYRAVTRRRRLN
jgi:hypothetical protein